eukprot:scaffold70822_cov92-Phaeocystis_antarctica.AAC.4
MPAGRNQGRCALAVGAWRSNPGHPSAHVLRVRWHRRRSEPQVAPDDRVRAGSSRRHGEAGRARARLQSLPTHVSRAKVAERDARESLFPRGSDESQLNPGPSPGNGGELETSLSRFRRNLAR